MFEITGFSDGEVPENPDPDPSPGQVPACTRAFFLIFEPKAAISVHQYAWEMMILVNQSPKRSDRKINSSIFSEFRSCAGFLKNLLSVSVHFSLCLPK
jgi:hypothetical protein